jgi:hypothetical protein
MHGFIPCSTILEKTNLIKTHQPKKGASMEDTLEVLIRRIRDKDPILTPPELEKQIADCVGIKINEAIKQTVADGPIELLQQAIQETMGLSCEVTPALSLYVNVSNTLDQETFIESFSSLPFEKALTTIAEKNFSITPSEKILDSINEAINQASEVFIHNMLLSHPLLMKIFRRFTEIFHEQLAIILHDPITVFVEGAYLQKENKTKNNGHHGTYL